MIAREERGVGPGTTSGWRGTSGAPGLYQGGFEGPRIDEVCRSAFEALYALEQHRGALEILLFLYVVGPATKSRMRQRLRPAQKALDHSLVGLCRLNLVQLGEVPTFPFSKIYQLTARGTRVVETPLRSWHHIFE